METKDFEGHTPGPWHVGERKARGWSDQADYFVYSGEDQIEPSLICRPYATDGYDGIAERNANAALIAAAPHLLSVQKQLVEALEEIVAYHIPDQPMTDGGDELSWAYRQHGKLRQIARVAILAAKASS